MNEVNRRAKYTLEFKLEAVRLVKGGQAAGGDCQDIGGAEADAGQLDQAAPQRATKRGRRQTGKRRADGTGKAASRERAPEDGARHFKKATAYFARESL